MSSVQASTIGSVHEGNDDGVVRLFINLLCMGYGISIYLFMCNIAQVCRNPSVQYQSSNLKGG